MRFNSFVIIKNQVIIAGIKLKYFKISAGIRLFSFTFQAKFVCYSFQLSLNVNNVCLFITKLEIYSFVFVKIKLVDLKSPKLCNVWLSQVRLGWHGVAQNSLVLSIASYKMKGHRYKRGAPSYKKRGPSYKKRSSRYKKEVTKCKKGAPNYKKDVPIYKSKRGHPIYKREPLLWLCFIFFSSEVKKTNEMNVIFF